MGTAPNALSPGLPPICANFECPPVTRICKLGKVCLAAGHGVVGTRAKKSAVRPIGIKSISPATLPSRI